MAIKVCKDCGAEISTGAKACPKCGKDQRNFLVKHKIITFAIIIVLLGIIVAIADPNPTNTTTNGNVTGTTQTQQQEKFTLLDGHTGRSDSFSYYIEGSVKNNTDKAYSYVSITFNVYDADGAQLGTAYDNINNLEANGTWKFKAVKLSDADKVASYKLVEIKGY